VVSHELLLTIVVRRLRGTSLRYGMICVNRCIEDCYAYVRSRGNDDDLLLACACSLLEVCESPDRQIDVDYNRLVELHCFPGDPGPKESRVDHGGLQPCV
jgi:hypothetical protein